MFRRCHVNDKFQHAIAQHSSMSCGPKQSKIAQFFICYGVHDFPVTLTNVCLTVLGCCFMRIWQLSVVSLSLTLHGSAFSHMHSSVVLLRDMATSTFKLSHSMSFRYGDIGQKDVLCKRLKVEVATSRLEC